MRRSVVTPFFPEQGFSMFDSWTGIAASPSWTTGKTATRQAVLGGPMVEQHWQLISVSFQAYIRWVNDPTFAITAFGKLGKILCGLSMDQALSFQADDQYLTVVSEMITDTSLMATLWDPASDPMPPAATSFAGGAVGPVPTPSNSLAVVAVVSPPNPLDLFEGVNPIVGIWMLPSLLGTGGGAAPNGIGLDVAMAKFTINYDDGL